MCDRYNGWTNYETWVVNLWMQNEESSYNYYLELAGDAYEEAEPSQAFTKTEQAALDLRHAIQEAHEAYIPVVQGVYADLLNASMSMVNWYEISTHLVDEYKENREE